MRKALFISAVCAAVLATACCGGKQKVCAIVAGPDKVAGVFVEYPEALDAESICPEAFVVEGEEVVGAKLVEPTKVVVALKRDCCGAHRHHQECQEPKPECPEAKPECPEAKPECPEAKPECPKAKLECEKCEIPVPEVSVKQVVDLKTADGKVVKAWKKAIMASEAVPAPRRGHRHHCNKPVEQQCDDCKAETQAAE